MIYSCGPLHIDEQRLNDQLEPTYNSSVPIQDIALKTFRERWTIETGGKRGSGRFMLAARHNICIYIYMCVCVCVCEYIYVCVYIYIYIDVCMYIYTHWYSSRVALDTGVQSQVESYQRIKRYYIYIYIYIYIYCPHNCTFHASVEERTIFSGSSRCFIWRLYYSDK